MNFPKIYQFKGDPEKYMIGSEVGSRLSLFKGALYKRFPKLWRRVISKEEKLELAETGVSNRVLANWEVMFIKASDGEAILRGEGQHLKGPRIYKDKDVCVVPTPRPSQKAFSTPTPLSAKRIIKGGSSEMHLGPLVNCGAFAALTKHKNWKRRELVRRSLLPSR